MCRSWRSPGAGDSSCTKNDRWCPTPTSRIARYCLQCPAKLDTPKFVDNRQQHLDPDVRNKMSADWAAVMVSGIAGLGSVGAFCVAIWVFIDANRIKKVEQLAHHYRMWAEFHQIEIDSGFLDKWGEFYLLEFDENQFQGHEHVVTYSILNLLRVSWTMCQEKVLHTSAQQEEVFNYFFGLRNKRDFLLGHIVHGGYDPSFYILFHDVTNEDREQAFQSFKKSLRRNWVSKTKKRRIEEINRAYKRDPHSPSAEVQTEPSVPPLDQALPDGADASDAGDSRIAKLL